MKDLAILAIARFGDLIQMTPLLRQLKKVHPETAVNLIVEDRFASILPLMRGFDSHVILNKREIACEIIMADDPLVPYATMEQFVRKIEGHLYDRLVNLTCTPFGAYLGSMIDAAEVAGIIGLPDGTRQVRHSWGHYVFSWFYDNNRPNNRINLVDVFTCLGGVTPDGRGVELTPTAKGEAAALKFLAEHAHGDVPLVGMQLGASEENRLWPAEMFAAVADRLQREHGVRIILFGAENERFLAEKAIQAMELPVIDAVGKTDIEGLYSLVKRCRFLITNDTGTMHFAAAGGVPSIMLCIGPAFFRGTGPYSESNLALMPNIACSPCPYGTKCGAPVCRTAISVDAVYEAALLLMGTDRSTLSFRGVTVHRSTFGADGWLTWEPVTAPGPMEEAGGRLERMWKEVLAGRPTPSGKPAPPEMSLFLDLCRQGLAVTEEIVRVAAKHPLPVELIGQLGAREAAVEEALKQAGVSHRLLTPLVTYLTLMRENLPGKELAEIAQASQHLYRTGILLATTY